MLIGKTAVAKMLGKRPPTSGRTICGTSRNPSLSARSRNGADGEAKHRASIGFAGNCGSFAESGPEFQ